MSTETFKAVIVDQQQLVIKELPRPVAVKGSIVLKNKVIGINYIDVLQSRGLIPVGSNGILGTEGVGEVVEVGEGVTKLKVGDRVLSLGGASHAEYSLVTDLDVKTVKTVKIPDNVSYAALGIHGLTAITLVNQGYAVQKGDVVLVHAAVAGGVGSALVQLIHQNGATVIGIIGIIGTVGSDEKAAFAKKLRADHIINYKKEDILERVLEITKGQGVHAALDSVGGTTFEQSVKSLRNGGVAISFGLATGPILPYQVTSLMRKNVRVQGSSVWGYFIDKEAANKWWTVLFDSINDGNLHPSIYKTYTLDAISEAFNDIAGGQTFGKLLVNID